MKEIKRLEITLVPKGRVVPADRKKKATDSQNFTGERGELDSWEGHARKIEENNRRLKTCFNYTVLMRPTRFIAIS